MNNNNYKSWFTQKREKLGRDWAYGGSSKEKLDVLIRDVTKNAERILTDISKGNIDLNGEDMRDLSSPAVLDTLRQFCNKRMIYFHILYDAISNQHQSNVNCGTTATVEFNTTIAVCTNVLRTYSEATERLNAFRATGDTTQIIRLQQYLKVYSNYIRLSNIFTA